MFFAGVMFAAWTLFAAAEGPGTYFVPPKGTDNVVSQAVSRAGDFNVRDVSVKEAARTYFIRGDPELPIENVVLENVTVRDSLGLENVAENVKGFEKRND